LFCSQPKSKLLFNELKEAKSKLLFKKLKKIDNCKGLCFNSDRKDPVRSVFEARIAQARKEVFPFGSTSSYNAVSDEEVMDEILQAARNSIVEFPNFQQALLEQFTFRLLSHYQHKSEQHRLIQQYGSLDHDCE
jgi:hypothetical protein